METEFISSREGGFSLLEAIIGLAIVALTLSAFYNGLSICIDAASKAREESVVVEEANRIFASLGVEYPLVEGTQTFQLPYGQTATLNIRPILSSNQARGGSRLILLDIQLALQNNRSGAPAIRMQSLRIKQLNAER